MLRSPYQVRQLGDIGGDTPRFVAGGVTRSGLKMVSPKPVGTISRESSVVWPEVFHGLSVESEGGRRSSQAAVSGGGTFADFKFRPP